MGGVRGSLRSWKAVQTIVEQTVARVIKADQKLLEELGNFCSLLTQDPHALCYEITLYAFRQQRKASF